MNDKFIRQIIAFCYLVLPCATTAKRLRIPLITPDLPRYKSPRPLPAPKQTSNAKKLEIRNAVNSKFQIDFQKTARRQHTVFLREFL
jgi:hypothetical protein